MYRMLYNDSFLFDPFDETRIVSSASITTNVNAASYLDFTIAANHPLYNVIEHQSGTVTLYSDKEKLFQGQITDISIDMDGNKAVTCASALDWLKDVQLRPYSTDQEECDEYEFKLDKAPDSLDAYFQWVIDQYNAQNRDERRFVIKVNQANELTRENIVYFASTSPQSVADAIEQNILGTFGGYLVLRYEDDELILDLYSDIHEMNEQIIDYGENILDITRNETTDDQYTAVYPIGKTPQYTADQQLYQDEKLIYDILMEDREETEKAEIDKLKKQEDAEQKRIDGITDKNAKKAAQDALKKRKEQRQAREQAFSNETKALQEEQKIKDDINAADKTKPNPITIESLNDGCYEGDLDIFKQGDVVYSMTYVQRYGYKEYVYTESDVEDKDVLLKLAVAKLKTLMAPMLRIDVRAVDQALYNPKHRHLFAGQAVRVRSKIQNVDEYMMVSSIDLDLIDPSQTTATLGVAYDTLTGQQSSYLKNLNSQIVSSVDAVDKLAENVKTTEITIGRVETIANNVAADNELIVNTVGDYKWMTDTAWDKADNAQEDADKANQGVTDTNIRIDNIKLETDNRIEEIGGDISSINTEIAGVKTEIEGVKQTAEDIRSEATAGIEAANKKADDIRTEANAAIDTVKTDLAATEAKAEQARQNASNALGGLSSANAAINSLRTEVDRHTESITNINGDIVGVRDTISGVAETANSALTVATTNTQAINEQSTRIDTAYADIESAKTSISEVKQTADEVKVNLETNYLDKTEIGNAYASKAELTATSESITSTVEKTYATKAALEGLQNIADAAIETWSGQTVPTASNPPASTWTTDELKKQHNGDIYYDMSTGKSYRWGSEDGVLYSWSLISDSDITKAIADAAKAQQTADGAKQDVVNLSNDIKATYTTKSEFKQTSDEIKASVTEVASANETNAQKIAEVSVKADGISAKVEEQATTIAGHTTSIGQLEFKADGLQTKFEQVSSDVDQLSKSIPGLINPEFSTGDTYGWDTQGCRAYLSSSNTALSGAYLVATDFQNNGVVKIRNTGKLSVKPGNTYRITTFLHADSTIGLDSTLRFRVCLVNVTNGNQVIRVDYPMTSVMAWVDKAGYLQTDLTIPDGMNTAYLLYQADPTKATSATTGAIRIRSVNIVNITESSEALKKTAELEVNLEGFKSTVSETYTTKDEFDNLTIGGRNLLKNTKTPKQVVGNNSVNQLTNLYELTTSSWGSLEAGQYMLSLDITYEGTISGVIMFQRDAAPWGFGININVAKSFTDENRTVHFEFPIQNPNNGSSKKLTARLDNVQGTVTFSNVKLEKGTKATDWSPAPEDMLDAATAATTYTTKSEFNQTKDSITARVEENASGIAGNTSSIGQLQVTANEISSKVEGVTETANKALTQSTTAIQDLNGFRQTVTQEYIKTEDANQAIADAIDDISVGGTNMLLDTQVFGQANPNNIADQRGRLTSYGNMTKLGTAELDKSNFNGEFRWRQLPSSVTTNNPNGATYQVTVEPNKSYTFSFDVWGDGEFWVYFYGPSGYIECAKTVCSTGGTPGSDGKAGDGNVLFTAPGSKWAHHEITWTLKNSTNVNGVKYILFRRRGTSGYFSILAPKLELGTKATGWSPSPFDSLRGAEVQSTYSTKSEVSQTESRITSTVESTYAKKTELSDEMKKTARSSFINFNGTLWGKLGRVSMQQEGRDVMITMVGGNGYNGQNGQNSQVEIHIRSSNSNAPYFGVSVNKVRNADAYEVAARIIDKNTIDIWLKPNSTYYRATMTIYGVYTDFVTTTPIPTTDDISTVEGTVKDVAYDILSTKSYVDQTANSVAIGVVEEYKNGQHGDKLTTSADITVLKSEINQTVAQQYADISEKIELKGSENVVQNPSFEVADFAGWESHDNWTYNTTSSAHTGNTYAQNIIQPNNANGNELVNAGYIPVEYGHTYRVSFWVKSNLDSGVYAYLRYLCKVGDSWVNKTVASNWQAVNRSWTQVIFDIDPPREATAIKVRIIGNNSSSSEAVLAVDDVSLTDYSVAKTINTTVSQIDQKADSISQTVRENYITLDAAIGAVGKRITGLENPNFDAVEEGSDRLTGWTANGPWTRANLSGYSPVQAGSGTYFTGATSGVADQTISLINDGYITTYPGMKLQISLWAWIDDNVVNNNAISIGVIQQNNTVTRELVTAETNSWKQYSATVTIPNNVDRVRVRIGFTTTARSAAIRLDSVSIADVTTANVALGKATTAVQDLEGFRQTVSNTYATKDTVNSMQSEWTQTAEGFTAAITANSYSVPVVNAGFESGDTIGWKTTGLKSIEVVNTPLYNNNSYYFTGVTTSDSNHYIENEGHIVARKDDYIKITARILVLDRNNQPTAARVNLGVRAHYNGVPYYTSNLSSSNTGWVVLSDTWQAHQDGTCSAYIQIPNVQNNYTVLIDDVELSNETEAIQLRSDLETRIAMTSNGVRVGKVVNDKFQGANVLMNADDGSFDILDGDDVKNRFTSESIDMIKGADGYQFSIKPFTRKGSGSVETELKGVNLISQGVFALNAIPATPASITFARPSGEVSIPSNGMCEWNLSNLESLAGIQLNAKTYHDTFYADMDNGNPPSSVIPFTYPVCRVSDTDGSSTASTYAVMILCPATYILQGVWNASKPSSGVACDIEPVRRAWDSSSYVSCGRAYRFSETTDSTGWTTKSGPIWSVNLDAGDRLAFKFTQQYGSGYKIGGGNFVSITRLPFSGRDMRQIIN